MHAIKIAGILGTTSLIAALTACGGMTAYSPDANRIGEGDTGEEDTFDTEFHPDTGDTEDTHDTNDCADSDGDGVCNSDDICHGEDDTRDADNDGVPDGCDICPDDRRDDSDGDGVCDSDDVCSGGNDTADQDRDGVPNDCDACPQDAANDMDGDGFCDSVDDPCPNDATNTQCTHDITLVLNTDGWSYESSWELYDDANNLVDWGYPAQDYKTYRYNYTAQTGIGACVYVYDSYGDGGMSGSVIDQTAGTVLVTWAGLDYSSVGIYCFTVSP